MLLDGGNTVHSSDDMRKIDEISEICDFCNFFKIYKKFWIDQQEKQKFLKSLILVFGILLKFWFSKKPKSYLNLSESVQNLFFYIFAYFFLELLIVNSE